MVVIGSCPKVSSAIVKHLQISHDATLSPLSCL